jgi:hypothetical protein
MNEFSVAEQADIDMGIVMVNVFRRLQSILEINTREQLLDHITNRSMKFVKVMQQLDSMVRRCHTCIRVQGRHFEKLL